MTDNLTEAELELIHQMARKIYPTAWGNHEPPVYDQNTAIGWVQQAYLDARKRTGGIKIMKKKKNDDSGKDQG